MTLADSFNDSGCGSNYKHDEEHNDEHDGGDYPQLNFNGGISLDNLNTHGAFKILSNLPSQNTAVKKLLDAHAEIRSSNVLTAPDDTKAKFEAWNAKAKEYIEKNHLKIFPNKSLINKITVLSTENPGLKTYVINYANIDNKKDKFKWNKEVLRYCKNNRIDLGPKPVRTKKETNKVNAKAHHLKNFSVEEHDEDGHHVLQISVKKHDHNKQTPVVKLHDHHKPTPVVSVDHYLKDGLGRIITQDGVARVAK